MKFRQIFIKLAKLTREVRLVDVYKDGARSIVTPRAALLTGEKVVAGVGGTV